jgi:hypothetical protein
MECITVKYRTWYRGIPPRPIKLQIPGWAGKDRNHGDGAEPQPWHCPPFVEGSTYGHELIYPYRSECRVKRINGQLIFEGDFSKEDWLIGEDGRNITGDEPRRKTPPMMSFASGHYGMSSSLDLEPPEGHVIRTEPHPRFFTDETGTVPCLSIGHIQRWWSRIFFVVFKAPREGEVHIFKEGEPYGQVLFVPQKNNIKMVEFTEQEKRIRESRESRISDHSKKIANHSWIDHKGLNFDDKYKVLTNAYQKCGYEGVDKLIDKKIISKPKVLKTKIPKRFFNKKR